MIKFSKIIPLILIMSSLVFSETLQKTQKEIIGQVDPFSSEIYINRFDDDIKIFNEKNEELKYEVLKNNTLKISYVDTLKPQLTLKNKEEIYTLKEFYPKSEINEKTYRDKNFNVFEIKNSYLYSTPNIIEGEYLTIIPTDEVFINIMINTQPYEAITENNKEIKGSIFLTIYNCNENIIETEEIKVYENLKKVDIPQKEIYHKKFKEPIKIKLKWKFELGTYKTKIYDKETEISVIKDINLMFRYKDVENIYYQTIE